MAAALCNDAPATSSSYALLLRRYLVDSPPPRPAELAELGGWADRLRAAFGAEPADQLELVNTLTLEAACVPRVVVHDGLDAHLHFAPASASVPNRIRAITAGGLAMAIVILGGERLGACGRSACANVYLDTSRSGRRRYCSVRCANAARVARHRLLSARRAHEPAAGASTEIRSAPRGKRSPVNEPTA